jgi:hypothetical protein
LSARRHALALAAAAGLLAPASAGATVTTFGSTLTAAPDAAFGCEVAPFIADTNGNNGFGASGQPDCTWRQQGVFASATDPRFSSVPGDGRITRVEVLTAKNPAPLRFVVIRQLGNVGGTQNSQCCFFVSETAPVRLAPDTLNSIPLDIPVERNTLKGIRAFDLMGISAASNTGALPLREVGPHNIFATTQPGTVSAGYFYPRMGSVGNDTGGGRPEQGVSGIELTVRWTWVSADDPRLNPVPALGARSATVRDNAAALALRCAASAACVGRLALLARATGARAAASASYGTAAYRIAKGRRATVRVRLNAAGRRALRRRSPLTVTASFSPAHGKAVRRTLTLRPA